MLGYGKVYIPCHMEANHAKILFLDKALGANWQSDYEWPLGIYTQWPFRSAKCLAASHPGWK